MTIAASRFLAPDGALVFDNWYLAADSTHIDPYTIWSLQTNFRQFRTHGRSPQVLDFLVELVQPFGKGAPQWPRSRDGAAPVVPPIYRQPMPGSKRTARHITLRLPMQSEHLQDVADAVLALISLKEVKRVQIGFPRPDDLKIARVRVDDQVPLAPIDPRPGVVLGTMEDGCPFGHPALMQTGTRTRVVALWDQSSVPADGSDPSPPEMGYGRERLQGILNRQLGKHRKARAVDEEALYLDPASMQRPIPLRGSHAAAVITLLAGKRSGLPSPTESARARGMGAAPRRRGSALDDDASRAPLVVVQFPREQINVVGARWLMVRALDGLRYLAHSAAQVAPGALNPVPLVINLSYGSMVGAHDGTGLFESAMDELAAAHRQMAIVLAAGNSFGTARAKDSTDDRARVPSGRRAVREMLGPGEKTLFRLYIPPDKPIETYLEIWFDLSARPDDEHFLGRRDVEIRATSPLGRRLRVSEFPGVAFDDPRAAKTGAGLLCFPRVTQSLRRSMALLVVAGTQISTTRVEAPSGVWTIEVINRGQDQLRVQAWVERDLIAGAARRSQSARLLPTHDKRAATLSDSNTLNNIATGENVFRVGALIDSIGGARSGVSPYSSAAEAGRRGPEFSAVADESGTRPGIRVSGNGSGAILRMNGTSVSAPQAARWVANRLARGVTLADIRREIAESEAGDDRRGRITV